MNRAIYKYLLELTDEQSVDLPHDACILSVQAQGSRLCLWASVDPDSAVRPRRILIRGTGKTIDHTAIHLATVIDGPFVWHVFEGLQP